jgi:hypothetical protein
MTSGRWSKAKFAKFDAEHPDIYRMFERAALQISKTRKTASAKDIFHGMRWNTNVTSGGEFKIDDGWISHYARKFMDDHPSLKGFFTIKNRTDGYHKEHIPETEPGGQVPMRI